jgi:hypothetical protein
VAPTSAVCFRNSRRPTPDVSSIVLGDFIAFLLFAVLSPTVFDLAATRDDGRLDVARNSESC